MITAEQRELRKKHIGSSDAPAILGVDPYRSAADVWLEKTGRVEGFAGNEDTERGQLLEPVLIEWAAGKLGRPLRNDGLFVVRSDAPELCANLDAFEPQEPAIVEAKTSVMSEEWGEPGTDEVPERVLVQVHHAMWCVGETCRVAYPVVLLPGYRSFDFRLYRVERNDELAETVARAGIDFMRNHVLADAPPDDFRPSMEVLRRVRREPDKTIQILDAEIVEAWSEAKGALRRAELAEEEAKAMVLALLQDAECGEMPDGRRITFLETTRRGYTVADSTYRQLRLVKAAKPKGAHA